MKTPSLMAAAFVLAVVIRPDPTQQSQQPVFRSSAEIVEVTVVVTDRAGKPVRDLTARDFDVREDRVQQTITEFIQVARSSEPTEPRNNEAGTQPTLPAGAPEGLYVIVLDSLHVEPGRTVLVRRQARQFIEKYMTATDLGAVVLLGPSVDASLVTKDKGQLVSAVDRFVGSKSGSTTLNKLAQAERTGGLGPVKDPENAIKAFEARTLLDGLTDISARIGTVPNVRRAIVLFSEGVEFDLTDLIGADPRGAEGELSASSRSSTYAGEVIAAQKRMLDAARRANAVLHTVDPRGTTTGADTLMSVGGLPQGRGGRLESPPTQDVATEVRRSQGVLRTIASETGGVAVVNTSDFERGFRQIALSNAVYYVLGYRSTNERRDGRYRRITVDVRRRGLTLAARKGYYAPDDRLPEAVTHVKR